MLACLLMQAILSYCWRTIVKTTELSIWPYTDEVIDNGIFTPYSVETVNFPNNFRTIFSCAAWNLQIPTFIKGECSNYLLYFHISVESSAAFSQYCLLWISILLLLSKFLWQMKSLKDREYHKRAAVNQRMEILTKTINNNCKNIHLFQWIYFYTLNTIPTISWKKHSVVV